MDPKDKYKDVILSISDLRYDLSDLFSSVDKAIEENSKNIYEIDDAYKKYAATASTITALIFEKDPNISLEEARIINQITLIAGRLGTLQYEVGKLKKRRVELQNILLEISQQSSHFAELISGIQPYTREIIHGFKALGYNLPDPNDGK